MQTPNRLRIALAISCLIAVAAYAEEARVHGTADTATVTAVDAAARRLTVTSEGRTQHYQIVDATRIQRGSEALALGALQPGTRVAISASREGASADALVADLVQVVQGPAPGAVESVPPREARAALHDASGQVVGEARLRDSAAGLLVHVSLVGLPPGVHAFHVHQTGVCVGDFESAGEHLEPAGRPHGFLAGGGPHAGDMVNLSVPAGGKLEQELRAPDLSVEQLLDADGAALIVHAGADDYSSQPSGAAGARIACGEVRAFTP